MDRKKIFILLPDGVGLRNFAYSNFNKIGVEEGFEVIYWNNTPFDLHDLGFQEIKIQNAKTHYLTDVLKRARFQIDLNLNVIKFNDKVYDRYRSSNASNSFVNIVKFFCIEGLALLFSSTKGVERIKKSMFRFEKKTKYFNDCLEVLKKEKPDFVFCTNQRITLALAPLLAAEELKIPTGTFIFSWDNLPKATLILEPNFYFVWSHHMKMELLSYYPFIKENQIRVTGTPQFEMHTDPGTICSRAVFFAEHHLDESKKYICYSGDDITTSPNDPIYLEDTAKAVMALNTKGHQLGIIFRRCPVDFSDRFDGVLKKYKDIIVVIDPKWKKVGDAWNNVLPTKEDMFLQLNTIAHSEMVVNLGSSMVFDYASFGKPCAYICYNIANSYEKHRSVEDIYDFVHFRSMSSKDAVLWIKSPEAIEEIILRGLEQPDDVVRHAQNWFEKINLHPTGQASTRILNQISQIIG
jgi:hypothetical protein